MSASRARGGGGSSREVMLRGRSSTPQRTTRGSCGAQPGPGSGAATADALAPGDAGWTGGGAAGEQPASSATSRDGVSRAAMGARVHAMGRGRESRPGRGQARRGQRGPGEGATKPGGRGAANVTANRIERGERRPGRYGDFLEAVFSGQP
jgi:hypothetical protein